MAPYKPSAAEVKTLREQTGAPMMDVRGALAEAEGDTEEAIKILRKKGLAASRSPTATALNACRTSPTRSLDSSLTIGTSLAERYPPQPSWPGAAGLRRIP